MIDDATLAEWELTPSPNGYLQLAVKEIRWLREELAQEPTREWYEKRCAWYGDELDRRKADLAAHRAVVRELADFIELIKDDDEARGENVDEPLRLLAHPLVQQAREAPHA